MMKSLVNPIRLGFVLLLCPSFVCEQRPEPSRAAPVRFSAVIEHPYLPMRPGTVWIYEGDENGLPLREEMHSLYEGALIAGVACLSMRQFVFLDGELIEVCTDWYAQDSAGNVWKFGQESYVLDRGRWLLQGAWKAGVDDAQAWVALSADPCPGEQYFGRSVNGIERFRVVSVTARAAVTTGTYANCVEILEDGADTEDADIVLYAPGVGRVSEHGLGGSLQLVSVQVK